MARKRPHQGRRRRGSGKAPLRQRQVLTGTLRITRPGVGSVETPEGTFELARHGMREGMNGDEVQVTLVDAHGIGKLAYVQLVLQRAVTTFAGRYGMAGPLGVVTPLDGRLGHDFFVVPEDHSAETLGVSEGDVVVARIAAYPTRNSAAVVTIERRLGTSDELDVNVEAVIASYGLATEFTPAALEQAETIVADAGGALSSDSARRDLRGLLAVTIDPADARDFDDAVSASRLDDGGFELWVHIADVTHYVGWDTPIDNEAKQRTCSVYLVDRVLPMLPERLCNDVCSLKPGEDRLTVTVRMTLAADGRLVSSEMMTSAIRSSARLTYDQVDAVLEGTAGADSLPCRNDANAAVAESLRVLDEIRALREQVRHDRGAIDFQTVEAKVMLDPDGKPTGVSVRRRTRATGLIEEAMILANECVAHLLATTNVETAYRVHEQPSPDDLRQTVQPLRELGLLEGATVARLVAGEPAALQDVLEAARGGSGEYLANALLLRAQKRAVYLPRNSGHYALGAKAYCHFTSPIRRYPDDLVHRALKAHLAGKDTSAAAIAVARRLPQLCHASSSMERTADAASRASQDVKMAELYSTKVGGSYPGIVTGCERFGLFVRLDDTCAEGLLPVRALGDRWLSFDDARMTLSDESSGVTWRLGQRVVVEVAGVDVPRGRIEFRLPEAQPTE